MIFPRWRDTAECRFVGRLLQAYLDGELGPGQSELVARHLDGCLRCGLEAETYRWLRAHLAGAARAAAHEERERLARLRAFAEDLAREEELR